jgi:hypothetical protein
MRVSCETRQCLGQTLVRVKGHALSILSFDVATGQQVNNPDTAKCLWAAEWQIVITENDKDQVLFEKGVGASP